MLRKTFTFATGVLLVTGCANSPRSYMSLTPRPLPDAYACALSKVNELGYTVTNTNEGAGFIAATKQTSGLGTKLWSGSEYHDQLTVSIFVQQGSDERTIRATAGRVDQRSNIFGTSTNAVKPTSAGISDARVLLSACGQGTVVEQQPLALQWAGAAAVPAAR